MKKQRKKTQKGKGFMSDVLKGVAKNTLQNLPQILGQASIGNKKAQRILKNKGVKLALKSTRNLSKTKRKSSKTKRIRRQRGSGLLGSLFGKVPVFGDLSRLIF